MIRRLVRWGFGSRSQPDVLVALLVVDLGWNLFMPKEFLQSHEDRIGIQPGLRPWLNPIKVAAIAGLLLGRRWPKLGAVTAAASTVYFAIAAGYHVRAQDTPVGTAPAVIYGGAAARSFLAFRGR